MGLSVVLLLTLTLSATYTLLLAWLDQALMFNLIKNNLLTTFKITIATIITLLALMRYFYVQDQWSQQIEAVAKAQ